MIPKEEAYIPPMNIKILDHRNFGRKPIVGVHVIKSLSKYRVNRENEMSYFSNIEGELEKFLFEIFRFFHKLSLTLKLYKTMIRFQ